MNSKIVAVDVGYGFVKSFNGESKILFPSVFSAVRSMIKSDFDKSDTLENLVVGYGGRQYFLGEKAIKERGVSTFDKNDMFRHLICILSSIALLEKSDFEGTVALGLPIADFDFKKQDLINLAGKYELSIGAKDYKINIKEIIVLRQGVSVFINEHLLITNNGLELKEANPRRTLIIDVGERTVDFISLDKQSVINAETGCLELGMSKSYKALCSVLQSKVGINVQTHEVTKYLDQIREEAVSEINLLSCEILSGISNYLDIKQFTRIGKILVSGGAADIIAENIKDILDIENCYIASDSQFSNVRGYYKYALLKQSQEQGGEADEQDKKE